MQEGREGVGKKWVALLYCRSSTGSCIFHLVKHRRPVLLPGHESTADLHSKLSASAEENTDTCACVHWWGIEVGWGVTQ